MKNSLISVCLCTYRREHVFATLRSIAAQTLPHDLLIEVVLVNNAPASDIASRVEAFSEQTGVPVRYFIEERKNISHARNTCLENATGDWVAFIDDDEIAHEEWLARLVATARSSAAEVVIGVVSANLPPNTPDWLKASHFFDRIPPTTGTEVTIGRTGNALLKADFIAAHRLRFDPAFGLTGGEDSLFFREIQRRGGRMVSCREAVVTESVEADRVNFPYIARRSVRGGETNARLFKLNNSLASTLVYTVASLTKMLVFAALAVLSLPRGKQHYVPLSLRSLVQIGKLKNTFGFSEIKMYE